MSPTKERAQGKLQVGSPRARVNPLAEADICPNDAGGITLTFKTRSPDRRVRVWLEPEGVALLLRQLFAAMNLVLAARHPEVLKLARLTVMLAEEHEDPDP
jgi:hypothetical protein